MIPGMYEIISTAKHAARHSTAQHGIVPRRMEGHSDARYLTALRCWAELRRAKLSSAGTWYGDTSWSEKRKRWRKIPNKSRTVPQVMEGGGVQVGGPERLEMHQPSPLGRKTKLSRSIYECDTRFRDNAISNASLDTLRRRDTYCCSAMLPGVYSIYTRTKEG